MTVGNMGQGPNENRQPMRKVDIEEANFLGNWGIIEVLVKNRRAVIWYPLVVAVAIGVFSLFTPAHYRGEVSVLPPDQGFQQFSLTSFPLAEFGLGVGMSLPFMATPSDILAHVLQSRRVLRAVADSLRLDSLWRMPSLGAAVAKLRASITVVVELTGLVRVQVSDRDPHQAALIANALVACADRINRSIVKAKAGHAREFIEGRLAETRGTLKQAADELQAFQRAHKTVFLDDELRVLIQNAATLKAQLTIDEIDLAVLKKNMSSQSPRVATLENRVSETRRRLQAMESGQDTGTTFLSTGFADAPQLMLDLAERTRRVKIEETILELLSSQLESAKIQEAKDTPTISVLDYADPNPQRIRPRRVRLVAASYATSLAVIIALSFAGEYFSVMRRRQPERHQRLVEILSMLRRDGLGLKRQTGQKG